MKRFIKLTGVFVLLLCLCTIITGCSDSDSGSKPADKVKGIRLKYDGKAITGNMLTVNLTKGALTFTADVQISNKDFTLESSDTDVATVAEKTVTVLKMGQADITATAAGDPGMTQTITLTVLANASAYPHSITNNFAEDSSTGLIVQWHNNSDIPVQALQIVPASSNFKNPRNVLAEGVLFQSSGTNGTFAARNIFRAEVTGLNPGTRYKYRMGTDERWSPEFEYLTSGGSNKNFSFTVVTDPQNDVFPTTSSSACMIATMDAANAFDSGNRFFLNCGDLTERIGNTTTSTGRSEIVNYTNAANRFNNKTPIAATQGNHDAYPTGSATDIRWNEASIFNAFVTFPDNGRAVSATQSRSYYFYYNDVLFIMLNTIATIGTAEANWLKDVLENDKNKAGGESKYKIAAMHIGAFGNHYYENGNVVNVRNAYGKIFTDYGVDIVFSGHDHTYGRSNPISLSTTTAIGSINFAGTPGGTVFSIAGATGPKFYESENGAYLNNQFPVKHGQAYGSANGYFVNVKVTGAKLSVTAKFSNGTELDAYEVTAKR